MKRVRLTDQTYTGLKLTITHNDLARIAGREQDFEIWPAGLRLLREFTAIDVRHDHIGEEKNHGGMLIERLEGVFGRVRVNHRITKFGQALDRQAPYGFVVLDNENAFTPNRARRRVIGRLRALDIRGAGVARQVYARRTE